MAEGGQRLSLEEAASFAGCAPADIARIMDLGLLPSGGPALEDINGIRLLLSLEGAGIAPSTLKAAIDAGVLPPEFARNLLPDPVTLSDRDYAALCTEVGLDRELGIRLFAAAGLPVPRPNQLMREGEVVLMRLVADAAQAGLPEQAVARVLRVFGQSARRNAEAMRDLFRSAVEARMAAQNTSMADAMAAAARQRIPLQTMGLQALQIMNARFLEDAVFENVTMRIEDALAAKGLLEPGSTDDPAVVFLDLAGYTALTREIGDDEAAQLAGRFEAIAQDTLPVFNGRLVKALGDGLLLLFREAARAPAACRELAERLARAGLPEVHAGLTVGPVIRRDGDIFGNSVNLAARLAGLAAPSQIVADAHSAALIDDPNLRWRPAGIAAPKGLPPTAIFTLGLGKDPGQR